jgi:nitrate/nitrite transporter NarK
VDYFSIIGIKIKTELGLNDTQFGILEAKPILTGSLSRLFLGVWAHQYGGRLNSLYAECPVNILSAIAYSQITCDKNVMLI